MVDHLRKTAKNCSGIFCPNQGETLQIDADTKLFQVKVTDELWRTLSFRNVHPFQIAYVRAMVTMEKKRRREEESEDEDEDDEPHEDGIVGVATADQEVAAVLFPAKKKRKRHLGVEWEETARAEEGEKRDEEMRDIDELDEKEKKGEKGGKGEGDEERKREEEEDEDEIDEEEEDADGWGSTWDTASLMALSRQRNHHNPVFVGEVGWLLALV
mgnify:CR=1 FL=1